MTKNWNVQAIGEAFSPQHPVLQSTSKLDFLNLFSISVSHFRRPGSGAESTDMIESGSNPDQEALINI